jgi:hypothetical protein
MMKYYVEHFENNKLFIIHARERWWKLCQIFGQKSKSINLFLSCKNKNDENYLDFYFFVMQEQRW